jgi:hypothetical protein
MAEAVMVLDNEVRPWAVVYIKVGMSIRSLRNGHPSIKWRVLLL